MDEHGYPEDDELKAIEKWDYTDAVGLFEFVETLVSYYGSFKQTGARIRIATGGWSVNESIIEALSRNSMVSALCWEADLRGGAHFYQIPERLREAS